MATTSDPRTQNTAFLFLDCFEIGATLGGLNLLREEYAKFLEQGLPGFDADSLKKIDRFVDRMKLVHANKCGDPKP